MVKGEVIGVRFAATILYGNLKATSSRQPSIDKSGVFIGSAPTKLRDEGE